MSFSLYDREQEVIDRAEAFLSDGPDDAPALRREAERLLGEYRQLLRQMRRLVSFSDRSQDQLNRLARSLDEKNRTLDGISSQLSKYLSPQVYQSIFSGRETGTLVSRRRKITVFFSDIKDFTAIAEALAPEDLTWILNTYFSDLSRIALDHGATIDKFLGDAMMAFFGDPESRGLREDARASVDMALAIQRHLKAEAPLWTERGFPQALETRMGINSGFCNVGNFGSTERMDYTVIGSAVNLAARLQEACPPGGVLVSLNTWVLIDTHFIADEQPPIMVKGVTHPVRTFLVTSARSDAEKGATRLDSERPGFSLHLDPAGMGSDQRAAARRDLEAAMACLDGSA